MSAAGSQAVLHTNLAVLRVADPGVFDELRAVLPLDRHIVGWLSPTEALIEPQTLRSLLDGLEARGIGALVRRTGPPEGEGPAR